MAGENQDTAVIGGHTAAARPLCAGGRAGVKERLSNQERALKEAHQPWASTE